MKRNVGGVDRVFRIVGGIVVLACGIYFRAWWALIGVLLLLTGLLSWCGLYLPFGISTCKTSGSKPPAP